MKFPVWLETLFGLVLGVIAGMIFVAAAGESPIHVLKVLFQSSLGSRYDIGLTLSYTAPLIFTGLSVAVAFHSGLFNIGAEGQLTLGTLAAAAAGVFFPNLPIPMALLIAVVSAISVAGLWGFIPGWFRVRLGNHEVITTIMLNFVAAGLASWFTLYVIPNPESQSPETISVGAGFQMNSWDPVSAFFPDTPASSAIILAILCALGLWIYLSKTVQGFQLRAVGQNEVAARVAGIQVDRVRMKAMFVAGAFAGLVCVGEVLGSAHRFRLGFSPDYGFLGIAVALLARNNPLGILFTALLFAVLHKGTGALDLETDKITKEFSYILQATIILFVSARALPSFLKISNFRGLKMKAVPKGNSR